MKRAYLLRLNEKLTKFKKNHSLSEVEYFMFIAENNTCTHGKRKLLDFLSLQIYIKAIDATF